MEREIQQLDVLKRLRDIIILHNEQEERNTESTTGISFLHCGGVAFLSQVNHFLPLTHPDFTSRLRLQSSKLSLPISPTSVLFTHQPLTKNLPVQRLLAAELLLGLLFLHQNGIVHQDIKPANVMVSPAGHVVITAFGAASSLPLISQQNSDSPPVYGPIVKQPGDTVTFTPLYAAPELLDTTGDCLEYDQHVDFYSFAILLFECATGNCFGEEHATGVSKNAMIAGKFGDLSFEDFLQQLVTHDFRQRLCGPEVKNHPFFDHLPGSWEDIASLKYPPLPPSTPSSSSCSVHSHHESPHQRLDDDDGDDGDNDDDDDDNDDGDEPSSDVENRSSSREAKPALNTDIIQGPPGASGSESMKDSPKSSQGQGTLWLKRSMSTRRSLDGSDCDDVISHDEVIPDYIISWITGPIIQPCDGENACSLTVEDGGSVYLGDRANSDSGLVIPGGIDSSSPMPRHRSNEVDEQRRPNLRSQSPSSSLSSPSSYSVTSSEPEDTDDDLLSALENYRRLEALLASGSYFTELSSRDADASHKIIGRLVRENPINASAVATASAAIATTTTTTTTATQHQTRAEPIIDISELVSDSVWRAFLQSEHATTWSFEDEITMAVLDAMEQRPPVCPQRPAVCPQPSVIDESEFGVIEEEPVPMRLADRQQQEKQKRSLRKTLEKVKRRFGLMKTV